MSSIINWLNTIPLEGPVRALVVVGIMLGFAAALYSFWEIVLRVAGLFRSTQRQIRPPTE